MATHEKFNFRSLDQLRERIAELGVDVRLQEDLSPLARRVRIGNLETPNSLGIHPMEGCDGRVDGAPDDLTIRRYDRFAAGGAGLLWFEATAVMPEGRANPHQLWIHDGNVGEFARLVERTERIGREQYGPGWQPVRVIQLTHSGRYCRPVDGPAPVIAFHHPILDPVGKIPPDYPTITDGELESLEERYLAAARLAWKAGFHGVDIKSTHAYLVAELLAGHTRPGRYGGSFENRTRFLLNVVDRIRQELPGLLLAVRLGLCDGSVYPHAWGMDESVEGQEDMAEPIRLARLLYERGVRLLNCTAGNPYYNAHITRPFDQNILQAPTQPNEHPLEGVDRLFRTSRTIQQAVPEMVVVNTGYSWLRRYAPMAAAANIANGWTRIAGMGREAFAYPDFARDILEKGAMDPRKLCTACSKCTQLMRDKTVAGCVTRDSEIYLPIYKEHCLR